MKLNLNRIKIVFTEHNKTGEWLSEKLGVNPATVSKWCTDTTQPNLYTLKKMAELLQVEMRELIK